ncbi:MAG: hypothetical protein FVQ81_06725 [Candidatus Glassbacteria bacterium]|nr:hypothetical protein [Candidatus Glassbacteria bacterium]
MKPVQRVNKLSHTETTAEKEELDRLALRAKEALRRGEGLDAVLSREQVDILRRRYSGFDDERDGDGFLSGGSHTVHKVATPRPFIHLINSNHDRLDRLPGRENLARLPGADERPEPRSCLRGSVVCHS